MKIAILFSISLLGFPFFNTEGDNQIFFDEFVECYYPNSKELPLYIYDNYEGEIIDTLYNRISRDEAGSKDDNYLYHWYKFAIKESKKGGWFKIENLFRGPARPVSFYPEHHGAWVHSDQLKINLSGVNSSDPEKGVWFFEKPNVTSKVIHKSGENLQTSLLAVYGDWAKVNFEVEGVKKEGWLLRADQCGIPWTTCPGYGGSYND